MERCKDCDHWRAIKGHCGVGRCNKLTRKNNLLRLAMGCETIIETKDLFGCVYFEPRPKGPFKVDHNFSGYFIFYKSAKHILGYWREERVANQACRRMNDEWERRE